MARFPVCRLIVEDAPQPGAWNMAVDESLLESVVAGGPPTVRWYRWSRPTVSLGYFQPPDAAAAWNNNLDVDVVRRLTGGGAILHHHEWTYSCTMPTLAPLLRHPYDLYDVVHLALCESLQARYGVIVSQRGEVERLAQEPVLCYQRQDPHDVCYRGVKVIGSAQRRRRGALLQHGSVLLQESPHAPGVVGIYDLIPELSSRCLLSRPFLEDLASRIGAEIQASELLPVERSLAETLIRESVHRQQ
jgi:lipoate-protein ligase A